MGQYRIAAWLLGLGIVLWFVTWVWNRVVRHRPSVLEHPEELAERHGGAPHN
jgi:hypothetical protein